MRSRASASSGDVVRHLHHVVEGDAGRFLQLKQQEIRERRLGPFNLRGKNRFLAHIGVEEQLGARQEGCNAVEPAEREECAVEALAQGF